MPISAMAQPEPQFSYTDEWSIVSAPPPSGPFRSIHLDPRIPGQGIAPPAIASSIDTVATGQLPADSGTEQQAAGSDSMDITHLPPPAAGVPAPPTELATPAPEPMTPPAFLPPPPGPADLSAPPVAEIEMPSGLLPPPPGPADMQAPPVAADHAHDVLHPQGQSRD